MNSYAATTHDLLLAITNMNGMQKVIAWQDKSLSNYHIKGGKIKEPGEIQ